MVSINYTIEKFEMTLASSVYIYVIIYELLSFDTLLIIVVCISNCVLTSLVIVYRCIQL